MMDILLKVNLILSGFESRSNFGLEENISYSSTHCLPTWQVNIDSQQDIQHHMHLLTSINKKKILTVVQF